MALNIGFNAAYKRIDNFVIRICNKRSGGLPRMKERQCDAQVLWGRLKAAALF
jgi:hypothetical protein